MKKSDFYLDAQATSFLEDEKNESDKNSKPIFSKKKHVRIFDPTMELDKRLDILER